jgi:hypothetical protein
MAPAGALARGRRAAWSGGAGDGREGGRYVIRDDVPTALRDVDPPELRAGLVCSGSTGSGLTHEA